MNSTVPVLVALDCSTTACKAVAFDAHGSTVAESRRYLTTTSPRPGWYEQSAEQWWEAAADALAAVAELLQPQHHPVALGLTNQRETFVCVDREGRSIRPAITWLDNRARAQVERLGSAEVHQLTGKPASTVPSLYKIAWLAEHEPQTIRRATHILDVQAYLARQLTGRTISSWASADSTSLIGLTTKGWIDELVEACGATLAQLPELAAPGQPIGPIRPEAAQRTGLPLGLPVIAGAGDGQCAGLGVGALTPSTAYLNLGTSLSLGTYVSHTTTQPGLRTLLGPEPGLLAVETLLLTGAATLTWLNELLAPPGLADLAPRAEQIPAGSNGLLFLPYLAGRETPAWRPDENGALFGLTKQHSREEIYRAVLEGLAYDQAAALEYLEERLALNLNKIIITGGLSHSPLVLKIFSAVMPRRVLLAPERECTALGAAILAAPATDNFPYSTTREAMVAMTRSGSPINADSQEVASYQSIRRRRDAMLRSAARGT